MMEFDVVWEDIVNICNETRQIRKFRQRNPKNVVEVTDEGLWVVNREEPHSKRKLIRKEWVKEGWEVLVRDGKMTTMTMPRPNVRKCSSFIMALLSHLSYVKGYETRRPVRIELRKEGVNQLKRNQAASDSQEVTPIQSKAELIHTEIDTTEVSLKHTDDVLPVFTIEFETAQKDIESDKIENDLLDHRYEGSVKVYYGKRYERDPENRKRAIEIHGLTCKACEFNFESVYGERGKDFIEVHHTKPLNTLQGEAIIVDPYTDLVPVCSNCHRMIHRRHDDVLTIEQLQEILKKEAVNA